MKDKQEGGIKFATGFIHSSEIVYLPLRMNQCVILGYVTYKEEWGTNDSENYIALRTKMLHNETYR